MFAGTPSTVPASKPMPSRGLSDRTDGRAANGSLPQARSSRTRTGSVRAAALIGAVVAAVHHAEVVAHRVGEPFGTLVLAVAVTVIEVALILSMMLAGGPDKATLPRDTIFAAVMIICNGVVGICLLVGGLRHREQFFRSKAPARAWRRWWRWPPCRWCCRPSPPVPRRHLHHGRSWPSRPSSLALWAVFVFMQTVRHRDYFLPRPWTRPTRTCTRPARACRPGQFRPAAGGAGGVVGLAKCCRRDRGWWPAGSNAPKAVVGIVIAMLVLLPETWAAVRAARANRLQTSMNLAIGSALASIGLTIPAVVVASAVLDLPLVLGLDAKDMVLLALTFLVGAITLASGRTNLMQGAVHLVIFAAFLFLALVP
jgi:Ca2+:H+ antiporter